MSEATCGIFERGSVLDVAKLIQATGVNPNCRLQNNGVPGTKASKAAQNWERK
jgi:hypothetical protein